MNRVYLDSARLLTRVAPLVLVDDTFLLSLVTAEPEWKRLEVSHLEQLPGLRWKLQNLERLRKTNARKFAEQSDALARLLT